uniref:GDSL esterase/lipase n=1 Tax=Davidia involucrata TaxID=16924 RepID=A0A5B7BXR6_DAVIN
MASSSSHFLLKHAFPVHILLIILTIWTPYAIGCYTAIFSFGDSLTDTGNSVHRSNSSNEPLHFALPPYGETYFHHPTGRSSDGRLIIDFIAQNLGLPFVPPYFGGRNASGATDFEKGVNFALVGANTLDSFFEDRNF